MSPRYCSTTEFLRKYMQEYPAIVQREWIQRNPPPDPAQWRSLDDPDRRVRLALAAFYRYYAGTAGMMSPVHRDAPDMPAVQEALGGLAGLVETVANDLAGGFKGRRARAQATATLRLALAFPTWEALQAQALDDAAKVALVRRWLAGVTGPA